MDWPRLGAVLHTTGLWGRSYLGVGRRATSRNKTKDSPPDSPPGEGAVLCSPSSEKEQIPTSPGCPRQGRFVDFLDDLGAAWPAAL